MTNTRDREFVEFVLSQLALTGNCRARAMFGGHGIYQGDTMFAIIADGRLYLKVDELTRSAFEERFLLPFTYTARGKTITMQYCEAPPEVFEEPEAMAIWARQAIETARRSARGKRSTVKAPP